MAKYVYGGTITAHTTAKSADVAGEFQKVETMSAAEEIRANDAIKFPAGEGNDIRITENPAQRASKVLTFGASGELLLKTAADAALVLSQPVLLETKDVISAVGAVEFTTDIDSTYDHYFIEFYDVWPGVFADPIYAQFYSAGAWQETADYDVVGASGVDHVIIENTPQGQSPGYVSGYGRLDFYMYHVAKQAYARMESKATYSVLATGTRPVQFENAGIFKTAAAISRIRFDTSNAAGLTGKFLLYGVPKP